MSESKILNFINSILEETESLSGTEVPDEEHEINTLLEDVVNYQGKKAAHLGTVVPVKQDEPEISKEIIDLKHISQDTKIEIEISEDKMSAFISVFPALNGGKELTPEEAVDKIKEYNITSKIDAGTISATLSTAVKSGKPVLSLKIAEGIPPKNGKNAYIEYTFKKEDEKDLFNFEVLDKIDYREIQNFHLVKKGDIVALKHKATKRQAGKTVLGEELPADNGKDVVLEAGEGINVSPDGGTYTAAKSGKVAVVNDTISVSDTYVVQENVDMNVGNIRFPGDVIIRGSVFDDFTIKVTRNILIMGNVAGATIIAGGNVIIHNGFRAKNKGRIVARGKVFARFVENARIESQDNIIISKAIINSHIKTPQRLIAFGEQGLIVGTAVYATRGVYANNIGSALSTSTYINVGLDLSAQKIIAEIDAAINKLNEPLRKINMVVLTFQKLDMLSLTDNMRQKVAAIFKKKIELNSKVKILENKRNAMLARLNRDINADITVKNTVYPGTTLRIGSSTLQIKNEMRNVTFTRSRIKNKIRIGLFKEWSNLKDLMKTDITT